MNRKYQYYSQLSISIFSIFNIPYLKAFRHLDLN